jgi:transposase
MAKYSEQFKLAVVKEYLSESSDGYPAVARRHGLTSHSMVERWVLAYRHHGEAGLAKKSSKYGAEFKLSVLKHMWDNHLSITQVAARFDIRSHSAVGMWERAYRDGGIEALTSRRRGTRNLMVMEVPNSDSPPDTDQRSREELVAEVDQLRMELAYLKKLEALVQTQPQQAPQKKRKQCKN